MDMLGIEPLLKALPVYGGCCGPVYDHWHILVDGEHVHSVPAKNPVWKVIVE